MKVGRKIVTSALAAVAAAGLVFVTSAPAAADVAPHKHCLLTPQGWVLIAEGVSDKAPNDPALENFHTRVHFGVPGGEPLTIIRISVDGECPQPSLP